jgi:cell division septum initiation protein DivIVA
VALSADSIENPDLPRARVGGYSIEATDELLSRVAKEYRQLQRDRTDLLTRQAELEDRLHKVLLAVEPDGERPEPSTTSLLASAYRVAAEMRAQAREECEAMLKKARRRADVFEREVDQARARTEYRVRELEETQRQARERLSMFLASMLAAIEERSETAGSVVRELRTRAGADGELQQHPSL